MRILIAVALLSVALIAGCNRSGTLPPLVEEEGAPQIPGKFIWDHLVTGDAQVARGGDNQGYYGDAFYTPPIDRYGYGFYGHP